MRGFRPPPRVSCTASDSEFGTVLPDTGLALEHHTFENIVGVRCTATLHILRGGGRVGYLRLRPYAALEAPRSTASRLVTAYPVRQVGAWRAHHVGPLRT